MGGGAGFLPVSNYVILAATGLKAWQLATTPDLGNGNGLLHTKWFNLAVVGVELAFVIWLLVGLMSKLT
jgi:hypothetical protein